MCSPSPTARPRCSAVDDSADGFRRYKELQKDGRTAGMVAFPNTLLIRGERDYLVDPGLIMQGGPVSGRWRSSASTRTRSRTSSSPISTSTTPRGSPPGRSAAPSCTGSRRRRRMRRSSPGCSRRPTSRSLDGEEGEIEPGLRWLRTPGHSDGLISLLRRHRRRPGRDRLRLRRPAARVLRPDGPARGLRARARRAARAVAADPRPRPGDRDPRAQPAGSPAVAVFPVDRAGRTTLAVERRFGGRTGKGRGSVDLETANRKESGPKAADSRDG